MKPCFSCKKSKQYSEYHKKASAKDGHQPTCIDCNRERIRNRQYKRVEPPELTPAIRKDVYTEAILRLKHFGIASDYTANAMLERVGNL